MKKRKLSLILLVTVMLFALSLTAMAADGFDDVTGEYIGAAPTQTIPVKLIIPEGAEAKFFLGTEGKGQIVAAVDKGVDEANAQIHTYEITVPNGSYSCMVSDETHNYGGVGFDVPLQTSIYEDTNITLALVKYYTTTTSVKVNGVSTPVSITDPDDFTVNLVAPGKAVIIPGENYVDSTIKAGTDYVVAPRMVWAYGNQILYNYTVELNSDLAKTFGVTPQINATFASTINAVQKKTFTVSALKTFTLTAPTDAETVFYYQINNFNDMVLEGADRVKSVDNGDGTTTYTVYYPGFANASYRITKPGYVTASGYCKDNIEFTATLRAGDPTSTVTDIASKAGAGSNIEYENSVLLNVDDSKRTNELAMKVGDTFRLRGFRAAWEIVNTVTANIMIEPDFHYAVLSGSDVVSVNPVTSQCTGNARGNWMDVTAEKPGQALIAVWYDAIDVLASEKKETTLNGTYGATDPARYGYVLVNVGEDYTANWEVVSEDGDWDAEFDTVYYYGDEGTFEFIPENATSVTVQNISGTTLGAVRNAEFEGALCKVPVQSGSNLITVNTPDGTDYMLVRAKKVTCTIENVTTGKTSNDEDFAVNLGDTVTVHFDQFNMPVPKMSGIYNPGYMGTAMTKFLLNDTYSLTSKGTQYDYICDEKSSITFDALIPGENVLSGGFIQSGSMGDNFGNHRNITDAGRGTNFSAVNVTGYFGSIEDIHFIVEDGEANVNYDDMVNLTSVSVKGGVDNYTTGFSFNVTKNVGTVNAANWTKSATGYSIFVKPVTKSYYNTITMSYWYEGEEPKSVNLVSGVETQVPPTEFTADKDKTLYIEITVTPGNLDFGPAKTYSFVVYPGSTSLQYVHPFLKSLTATADDETFAVSSDRGEGVLYTVTDYEMDVQGASKLKLTGTQCYYGTSASSDKTDLVTVTLMKDGKAMGDAITAQESGNANNSKGWTLADVNVAGADAMKIVVTSYVDETVSRTYTVALNNTAELIMGDVDGDGVVRTDDAAQVYAFVNGETELTAEQIALADLTGDGKVMSDDAALAYAVANGKN